MTATLAPLDPAALKRAELALVQDAIEAEAIVITNAPMAEAVGNVLIERMRQADAAQAFADGYTKPAYHGWKSLLDLFRPTIETNARIVKGLKAALSAWELKLIEEKAEAKQVARGALVSGDVAAMTEALTVANAPDVKAQGVSAKPTWRVKRVAEGEPCKCCGSRRGMVPAEYWTEGADLSKLADLARRHKGDDPPIVPGVSFELNVSITGRRA